MSSVPARRNATWPAASMKTWVGVAVTSPNARPIAPSTSRATGYGMGRPPGEPHHLGGRVPRHRHRDDLETARGEPMVQRIEIRHLAQADEARRRPEGHQHRAALERAGVEAAAVDCRDGDVRKGIRFAVAACAEHRYRHQQAPRGHACPDGGRNRPARLAADRRTVVHEQAEFPHLAAPITMPGREDTAPGRERRRQEAHANAGIKSVPRMPVVPPSCSPTR